MDTYDQRIQELFKKEKLLVRAMDNLRLTRDFYTGEFSYDYSTWANEYDMAKGEGLTSLSTTLIIPGEEIPTYKAMGFLIDSEKVEVRHISERDSGSRGSEENGDFYANETDIYSLEKLASRIRDKHEKVMNEININMRKNAYLGMFINKGASSRQLIHILMAQKCYEIQTGVTLPVYEYDSKQGTLEKENSSLESKLQMLQECLEQRVLRSQKIFYETEQGEYKSGDFMEEIIKNIKEKNQPTINEFGEIIRPDTSDIEKVNLSQIDLKNTFFHFTETKNIPSIKKEGLNAVKGENAKGAEDTKKVFFAKGTDGALEIGDVWIKWLMNQMHGPKGLSQKYQGEELDRKMYEWHQEFLSREYLEDDAKKT